MTRRTGLILIDVIGNVLLLGKYGIDALGIQCEPCLSTPCPPCRTHYMSSFMWYLLLWNLILAFALLSLKKKHGTREGA